MTVGIEVRGRDRTRMQPYGDRTPRERTKERTDTHEPAGTNRPPCSCPSSQEFPGRGTAHSRCLWLSPSCRSAAYTLQGCHQHKHRLADIHLRACVGIVAGGPRGRKYLGSLLRDRTFQVMARVERRTVTTAPMHGPACSHRSSCTGRDRHRQLPRTSGQQGTRPCAVAHMDRAAIGSGARHPSDR